MGALFTGAGYFLIPVRPVIGYATMIFFGLGAVVGLIAMFSPKSPYLHLDAEAFEIGSITGKTRVKWVDVQCFELGSVHGAKVIRIVYEPHYNEYMRARMASSRLSGMEGGISNSYNGPLIELLSTLNEWHMRYGSRSADAK